jgi:hypothetical protein
MVTVNLYQTVELIFHLFQHFLFSIKAFRNASATRFLPTIAVLMRGWMAHVYCEKRMRNTFKKLGENITLGEERFSFNESILEQRPNEFGEGQRLRTGCCPHAN